MRKMFGHAGWREISDQKYYFRSMWEANFARYLQFLKDQKQIKSWKHEPLTFWFEEIKRGVRSYLPDFLVIENDGRGHWVEVKGYMDPKSLTKIKRFRKYYPQQELRVIDKKWFAENGGKLAILIPGWEKLQHKNPNHDIVNLKFKPMCIAKWK